MGLKRLISLLLLGFSINGFIVATVTASEPAKPSMLESSKPNLSQITEQEVQALIEKIEKAGDEKKTDEILKYFAPFIYSKITVETDDVTETIELNGLEEHRLYLQNIYEDMQNYQKPNDNYKIRITPDGKMAIADRTRIITLTRSKGQPIEVSSKAEAILAKVDGKLLIVALKENIKVENPSK